MILFGKYWFTKMIRIAKLFFKNLTILFAFGRLIWMIQIIYKKVVRNLTVLFAFGRLIG